jgi:hypothetical protein
VGFNPFREQHKSAVDIVVMVVALAAALAVIVWAVFGG